MSGIRSIEASGFKTLKNALAVKAKRVFPTRLKLALVLMTLLVIEGIVFATVGKRPNYGGLSCQNKIITVPSSGTQGQPDYNPGYTYQYADYRRADDTCVSGQPTDKCTLAASGNPGRYTAQGTCYLAQPSNVVTLPQNANADPAFTAAKAYSF
jgi:hypothetical protein